ncbi:MAG: class I SAM-dependent methyltransferase [Nitrospirota bacterium]|nr:class I SAM-dependent methyltransferase [Nitrospirota bacterium]
MSHPDIERITPTPDTLEQFLAAFPDHFQRYEFAQRFIEPGHAVADIACGTGYGTWLLGSACREAHGYDIAPDAVAHANAHFRRPNMQFHCSGTLPPDTYDVVVSFETVEHMDEAAGDLFLQNLKAALHPKGTLIVSTPINKTRHKHNTTPFHVREYSDDEFPAKLQANGLEIVAMYGQGGTFHQRLYGGQGSPVSIFGIMKTGVHKLLPKAVRTWLKTRLLGDPAAGLSIHGDGWRNAAVQIAVCRISRPTS